jgi:hypothetical protein
VSAYYYISIVKKREITHELQLIQNRLQLSAPPPAPYTIPYIRIAQPLLLQARLSLASDPSFICREQYGRIFMRPIESRGGKRTVAAGARRHHAPRADGITAR